VVLRDSFLVQLDGGGYCSARGREGDVCVVVCAMRGCSSAL
jgi:hypothetical protein